MGWKWLTSYNYALDGCSQLASPIIDPCPPFIPCSAPSFRYHLDQLQTMVDMAVTMYPEAANCIHSAQERTNTRRMASRIKRLGPVVLAVSSALGTRECAWQCFRRHVHFWEVFVGLAIALSGPAWPRCSVLQCAMLPSLP